MKKLSLKAQWAMADFVEQERQRSRKLQRLNAEAFQAKIDLAQYRGRANARDWKKVWQQLGRNGDEICASARCTLRVLKANRDKYAQELDRTRDVDALLRHTTCVAEIEELVSIVRSVVSPEALEGE